MTKSPGEVLSSRQRRKAELEVISSEARLRLTRLLRESTTADEPPIRLIRQNAVINVANTVLNRPIYLLQSDDWGDYQPAEYGWHQSELELVLRRPSTAPLIEILHDLIMQKALDIRSVNEILKADRCGIRFGFDDDDETLSVKVLKLPPLATNVPPDENSNIRQLFDRLDRAMQDEDWALVLHSGASIFETLAKLVVPLPGVQNQSLGGFFAAFRKHSKLATPLLDVIEAIYKRRNIEPMAGHGSAQSSAITKEEAIQVSHLTRALVVLERELSVVGKAPQPLQKPQATKPKKKTPP